MTQIPSNIINFILSYNNDINCLLLSKNCYTHQYTYWLNISHKQELFKLACCHNKLTIVKLLLPYVDASDQNNYAIIEASLYGHTEVVKLLLENDKVDASDQNNYAIRSASVYGHTEVVKLLLENDKVDASYQNNSTIRWVSQYCLYVSTIIASRFG